MFSLLLPRFSFSCARPVLRVAATGVIAALAAGCSTVSLNSATANSERQAQEAAIAAQIDASLARVSDLPRWSSSLDDRAQFASFATDAVSVSYQGSAADLLKAIAAARNKTFKVTGPTPHIPIFVFVEAVNQPFEDFLRDLDKQFGQRADIALTDQAFELRYR